MAYLHLDKVDREYVTGKYHITVKLEPYKGFRLFEKIRFIDKFGFPFNYFCIIDKGEVVMKDYESRGLNEIDYIEYVDVFVSKYNRDVPLILRVCNRGQYKYYKWKELERNTKYDHKNLIKDFKPFKPLSRDLILENDLVNNKVTYIIDRKQSYHNIEVTIDKIKIPKFTKYTHKPKNGFNSRDSILIYTNKIINTNPNTDILKNQIPKKEMKHDDFDFKKFEYINIYYKNNVKNPLLIQFLISDTKSYYYSIRNRRIWNRIDINEENFKDEMDKIEYQLRPSIRFMLDQKTDYVNKDFRNAKKEYIKNKNSIKNIKTVYSTSEDLVQNDYVCYEHYFLEPYEYKNIIPKDIPPEQKYLAIIIYIFNIGIDTFDKDGKVEYLLYLPGEKLYVFYSKDDDYPLLFRHNDKYYKPNSRNEYFTKWVEVKDLTEDPNDPKKILVELDLINRMLNEININKLTSYGICDEMVEEFLDKDIDHICYSTECENRCKKQNLLRKDIKIPTRIKVESEQCGIYYKYIHKTNNKYFVGCVTYNSIEILKHVNYVRDYKDVSIEVYYFNFNSEKKVGHPLLIVCKSFNNLDYYYLIEKFERNETTKDPKLEELKNLSIGLYNFLEHQNFLLNNVINININKIKNYQCCDRSDFNCTKQVVNVQKLEIGEHSSLETKKYLTYKHSLEDKKPKSEHESKPKEPKSSKRKHPITVKNLKIGNEIIKLAHTKKDVIDPLFETGEAYVHFYDKDPRPLLVYTDGSAFIPTSLNDYRKNWTLVDDIDYSKRGDGNYRLETVLQKLHEISYLLNPVDISKTKDYNIHNYFYENITIQVKETVYTRYQKYTHTPSSGHKLGVLKYHDQIIDDTYSFKSFEIKEVIVYFFDFDNKNKYPIFIKLLYTSRADLYYILDTIDPHSWIKVDILDMKDRSIKGRSRRSVQLFGELPKDFEFSSLRNRIGNEYGLSNSFLFGEDTLSYSTLSQPLGLRANVESSDISSERQLNDTHSNTENQKQLKTRHPRSDRPPESTITGMKQNGTIPLSDSEIIVSKTPNDDPYNTVLANGLGGFFGTLFSLSLISILIYKFLSRLRVREMTPSF